MEDTEKNVGTVWHGDEVKFKPYSLLMENSDTWNLMREYKPITEAMARAEVDRVIDYAKAAKTYLQEMNAPVQFVDRFDETLMVASEMDFASDVTSRVIEAQDHLAGTSEILAYMNYPLARGAAWEGLKAAGVISSNEPAQSIKDGELSERLDSYGVDTTPLMGHPRSNYLEFLQHYQLTEDDVEGFTEEDDGLRRHNLEESLVDFKVTEDKGCIFKLSTCGMFCTDSSVAHIPGSGEIKHSGQMTEDHLALMVALAKSEGWTVVNLSAPGQVMSRRQRVNLDHLYVAFASAGLTVEGWKPSTEALAKVRSNRDLAIEQVPYTEPDAGMSL